MALPSEEALDSSEDIVMLDDENQSEPPTDELGTKEKSADSDTTASGEPSAAAAQAVVSNGHSPTDEEEVLLVGEEGEDGGGGGGGGDSGGGGEEEGKGDTTDHPLVVISGGGEGKGGSERKDHGKGNFDGGAKDDDVEDISVLWEHCTVTVSSGADSKSPSSSPERKKKSKKTKTKKKKSSDDSDPTYSPSKSHSVAKAGRGKGKSDVGGSEASESDSGGDTADTETPMIVFSDDDGTEKGVVDVARTWPDADDLKMKRFLAKIVIEFLIEQGNCGMIDTVTYDDLCTMVGSATPPEEGMDTPTSEDLIKQADFILEQIFNFDLTGDPTEDVQLFDAICIQELLDRSGISGDEIRRRCQKSLKPRGGEKKSEKQSWTTVTKATVTPLVSELFQQVFAGKINVAESATYKRKKRCGVCGMCQAPDCGTCAACKEMPKFGGCGKAKHLVCYSRKCPNMTSLPDVVDIDSDHSDEDDDDIVIIPDIVDTRTKPSRASRRNKKFVVEWASDPVKETTNPITMNKMTYYDEVRINEEVLGVGDFCLVQPEEMGVDGAARKCGQIIDLFNEEKEGMIAHMHWFAFGEDTILSNTSESNELFAVRDCEAVLLSEVESKVNVVHWPMPGNWYEIGGTAESLAAPPVEVGSNDYYYRMWYDAETGRFERGPQIPPYQQYEYHSCPLNRHVQASYDDCKPCLSETAVSDDGEALTFRFRGFTFNVHDAVFLKHNTFSFDHKKAYAAPGSSGTHRKDFEKEYDEDEYPERWRKTDHVKGSNEKTEQPVQIGIIVKIKKQMAGRLIRIKVRKLYRPENTMLKPTKALSKDLNLLYWSDEFATVDVENVDGKCWLRPNARHWSTQGAWRFYYEEVFDGTDKEFKDLSEEAKRYGSGKCMNGNVSSGGDGDGGGSGADDDAEEFAQAPQALRSLDVFAGAGGLSEGLHQAGVAESRWAIEIFEPAAKAFKVNNPDCTVFQDDCNDLLRLAMEGQETNKAGQRLPKKGEVELMCGGPPCQGFSGLNRHISKLYSQMKNSLISSFLSYCDFFRPKFFILENVRNLVTYNKGLVLKLILAALVRMGYQCSVAVMQSGHFGVPQSRLRTIVLAAAPDQNMPKYPIPWHVFCAANAWQVIFIDGRRYEIRSPLFGGSAPYRPITVRDAMTDLPPIPSGERDASTEMAYAKEPEGPFQRTVRNLNEHAQTDKRKDSSKIKNLQIVRDHFTKDLSALAEARMKLIPTAPGSDWRDLPNRRVRLRDGTYTELMKYKHKNIYDPKWNRKGARKRGVCSCLASAKGKCNPEDKQTSNTIIPWCLPHTAQRHSQWSGSYGRVNYDGFFSTMVTTPDPVGKSSRVLHPEQARTVSVREAARCQGFPDWYKFYGNAAQRYRQVGNAVPPPVAKALGMEIAKCLAASREDRQNGDCQVLESTTSYDDDSLSLKVNT